MEIFSAVKTEIETETKEDKIRVYPIESARVRCHCSRRMKSFGAKEANTNKRNEK